MIEVDIVGADGVQLIGAKQGLARIDVAPLGLLRAGVEEQAPVFLAVDGGQFQALGVAIRVVERRQDQRLAELAFVQQVVDLFIVHIGRHGQFRTHLVADAHVIVVCAFGLDVVGLADFRRIRRVRIQVDAGLRRQFLRRRREVARIARVQGRVRCQLIRQVDARAPLLLARVGRNLVEAGAVIQGQGFADMPFILQVDTGQGARLAAVVGNADRRGSALRAVHAREDGHRVVARRFLVRVGQARAHGVVLVQLVADVELRAGSVVGAARVGSHAVVDQVADGIGREVQCRILVEGRHLVIEVAQAFLQRQHQKTVHFALVFIQLRRRQTGRARLRITVAVQGEGRRLVRIVGDLEAAVVGAEHGAQARVVIEEI